MTVGGPYSALEGDASAFSVIRSRPFEMPIRGSWFGARSLPLREGLDALDAARDPMT